MFYLLVVRDCFLALFIFAFRSLRYRYEPKISRREAICIFRLACELTVISAKPVPCCRPPLATGCAASVLLLLPADCTVFPIPRSCPAVATPVWLSPLPAGGCTAFLLPRPPRRSAVVAWAWSLLLPAGCTVFVLPRPPYSLLSVVVAVT